MARAPGKSDKRVVLSVLCDADGTVIGACGTGAVTAEEKETILLGIAADQGQRVHRVEVPAEIARLLERPDDFFRWANQNLVQAESCLQVKELGDSPKRR